MGINGSIQKLATGYMFIYIYINIDFGIATIHEKPDEAKSGVEFPSTFWLIFQ